VDDDTVSSASLIRKGWEFFPVGVNFLVIAAIFITAIVIGGQHLGFWLDNQDIQHAQQTQKARNKIIQGNSNVQQGYIEAISTDVTAVDTYLIDATGSPNRAAMIAAAVGYGNQACLEASYLTGTYTMPAQMQSWISANCSGGAVRIDSPIRSGKGN
jgi:hypothetical protein